MITMSVLMTASTALLGTDDSTISCKIDDALNIVQDPNYWDVAKKPCAQWPYTEKGEYSPCVYCLANLMVVCDDTLKTPMSRKQVLTLDKHCRNLTMKK